MATWYVRKTGSDNNGGTSPSVRSTGTDGVTNGTNTLTSVTGTWSAADIGQGIFIGGVNVWRTVTAVGSSTSLTFSGAVIAAASGRTWTIGGAWVTVGKSLNSNVPVVGGDTVYIGAGVYREVVSVSLAPSSVVNYIGDVQGLFAGDRGEVQITSFLTNNTTAATNTSTLTLNGHGNLSFSYINWINGVVSGRGVDATTAGSSNITFDHCMMWSAIRLFDVQATVDVALNWTLSNCIFISSGINVFAAPTSATADYDLNVVIKDCLMINMSSTHHRLSPSGANSGKPGGIKSYNCWAILAGAYQSTQANSSTTYPCIVYNCVLLSGGALNTFNSNGAGQILEDYNYGNLLYTNTTAGTHSQQQNVYAPLFEWGQSWLQGTGSIKPFMIPTASSPLLAFGNHAGGPSTDIMGTTWAATPAVGAFELNTNKTGRFGGEGMGDL